MTHNDFDYDEFDEDALIEEILAMEGHEPEAVADPDLDGLSDDIDLASIQPPPQKPTIAEAIEALKNEQGLYPVAALVYGLSDISTEQVDSIRPTWQALTPPVQRAIMRGLIESQEASFQLDYRTFGFSVLDSADPRVREHAIEILWEDQSLTLMHRLITIAQTDENRDVRAAAAGALGRFILAGELDEIPHDVTQNAETAVFHIWEDESEDVEVRRRALESFANCSRPSVTPSIQSAYESTYPEMRVSALFAMGRTADKRWQDIITMELDSHEPAMRYEAARAAGEINILEAVPKLAEMTLEDDRELMEIAIWSLGEIGGRAALRVLESLVEHAEEQNDYDLVEAIEDAMGSATLASELDDLDF